MVTIMHLNCQTAYLQHEHHSLPAQHSDSVTNIASCPGQGRKNVRVNVDYFVNQSHTTTHFDFPYH